MEFKLTNKNTKLLRRVQKHILAEPRCFAMGVIKTTGDPGSKLGTAEIVHTWNNGNRFESQQAFPSCGTIACISGWADILNGKPVSAPSRLIVARLWPDKFASRYREAKTPLTRAKIASQRIDHFIKTKGKE